MPNEYVPGQGVLVRAEFYDRNGAVVDPTTVTLTYKKPDTSTVVTVAGGSLTKLSTGVYEYTIDTTAGPVGDWHYRFTGTGAALGANEGVFYVRRSQVV